MYPLSRNALRFVYAILVIIIVIVLSVFFVLKEFGGDDRAGRADMMSPSPVSPIISEEVQAVLDGYLDLVEDLSRDMRIIDAVVTAGREHVDLTEVEIEALDRAWSSADAPDSTVIERLLHNDAAQALIEFQEEYIGFSEIFVTDMVGLNVGQTNRTTDYYQADETWWIDAYNGGAGYNYYGSIEFDESAQSEAISLYVTVKDGATGDVIGVIKAVLSVAAIKIAL